MTNSQFGQEVCLSTYDICSPTCPFLLTLMLGSSLKTPLAKKKVLARHNVPTTFMKGLANYSQNVFIKRSSPDSILCSIFSVGVCV